MQDRPELTFPEEVAAFVRTTYQTADVVLEYGSGGSTVLAAETAGLRCFSVESDPHWARGLRAWLDANVPDHGVVVHHADVGPTREWGWPETIRKTSALRYAQFPRSVWSRPDFQHPDVVLIDGRFRVGCFLATIARIKAPTTILFDDYDERANYRVVERFFQPKQMIGRMAVFDAAPRRLNWLDHLRLARVALNPA